MPRIRYRKCYLNFGSGVFHCSGNGPLSQAQVNSVWCSLPTTGAGWVERGHLRVQSRDGGTVFDLGPVARGVRIKRRCK
jgi:hypothetical protein